MRSLSLKHLFEEHTRRVADRVRGRLCSNNSQHIKGEKENGQKYMSIGRTLITHYCLLVAIRSSKKLVVPGAASIAMGVKPSVSGAVSFSFSCGKRE